MGEPKEIIETDINVLAKKCPAELLLPFPRPLDFCFGAVIAVNNRDFENLNYIINGYS